MTSIHNSRLQQYFRVRQKHAKVRQTDKRMRNLYIKLDNRVSTRNFESDCKYRRKNPLINDK